MIKCLYLRRKTIKEQPKYFNLIKTIGCEFPDNTYNYRLIKISLPNTFKHNDYPTLVNKFKKLFNYKYLKFNFYLLNGNLFLDIIYIDREVKFDYNYSKSNIVFYKSSGKKMKDIRKYNENNKNHLLIEKGNIIPKFIMDTTGKLKPFYIKTEIFSKSLENKKLYLMKKELKQLKKDVSSIINDVLNLTDSNTLYVSSSTYYKLGFKKLYSYLNKGLEAISKGFNKNKIDIINTRVKKHNKKIMLKIKDKIYRTLANNRDLKFLF